MITVAAIIVVLVSCTHLVQGDKGDSPVYDEAIMKATMLADIEKSNTLIGSENLMDMVLLVILVALFIFLLVKGLGITASGTPEAPVERDSAADLEGGLAREDKNNP